MRTEAQKAFGDYSKMSEPRRQPNRQQLSEVTMKPRTANRLTALAVLILLGTTAAATHIAVQARSDAADMRAHIAGLGHPCRMWTTPPAGKRRFAS